MGIFKDMWSKSKFGKDAEEKKRQQELENEVRQEIQAEIKQEAKQLLKEKIKQEEIDKIVNPEKNKKSNFLAKLGEEFKGSNIGSTDQMNKMMGKDQQNTSQNNRSPSNSGLSNDAILKGFSSNTPQNKQNLGAMMGGSNVKTSQNPSNLMGTSNYNFGRDNKSAFGVQNKREQNVVGLPDTKKQVDRMLGSRK